jgi:hypothetical protein
MEERRAAEFADKAPISFLRVSVMTGSLLADAG